MALEQPQALLLVPPFKDLAILEPATSLILSQSSPEDIHDLMSKLSRVPPEVLEGVTDLTITSCVVDYESASLFSSLWVRFPRLESLVLRDIDWKYPRSLKETLINVVAGDEAPSISERYFWYNSDSGNMPRMGRAHWDLFKTGQVLVTSLFYYCRDLLNLCITRCSLGCMWRPRNNQGYDDTGSSIFSILMALVEKSKIEKLAVEDCDIYDAHLRDVPVFWFPKSSLREISLRGNIFSGIGLSHLLTEDVLCEKPALAPFLRTLYLDHCLVLETEEHAIEILKRFMLINPDVRVVLSNNRIYDESLRDHPQVIMESPAATGEVSPDVVVTDGTPLESQDSEFFGSDSVEASIVDDLTDDLESRESSSDDISLVSEGSDILKMYQESI